MSGSGRRLFGAVAVLLLLTVLGTAGFMAIEGMTALDALYMAVITLSTVGYGEVQPLSPWGRGFSILLIMTGLGAAFYTVGALAEFLLEGRLTGLLGQRTMKKKIDALSDHVILVGVGRFGAVVAAELSRAGADVVAIEVEESRLTSLDPRISTVVGSALEEQVLLAAGIERAGSIVITTADDADNVFVALNAKELNPSIRIFSRAETEPGERRLMNAGARLVVSPHQLGGQRLAQALLRPAVVDFIELASPGAGAEIDLEEVLVAAGSDLEGASIAGIDTPGLVVVGLKHRDDSIELSPAPETALSSGDRLVVVGRRPDLQNLSRRAGRQRSG